jgi:hypothetical protein
VDDSQIHRQIEELVAEEHQLWTDSAETRDERTVENYEQVAERVRNRGTG